MSRDCRTVLVVDDDADLAAMVELLLDEGGFQATRAGGGQEALRKVALQMPDVILLDMRMPGMDGWAFAREFRSRYGHRCSLVVMTAGEDAEKNAREIGAEGYLGKPFEFDELIQAVQGATAQT
ncbi:MAG TPA: response regulator [Myxococcales bacterium]|jgi:CheY-like chemotaxis protein